MALFTKSLQNYQIIDKIGSSYTIREANVSDLETIHKIEQENNLFPWSIKNLQASLSEHLFFVVEINGVITGFIVYQFVLDVANLLNISVKKEYQNLNLGSNLISLFQENCRENDIKEIFLEVRVSNKQAFHLYTKLNFNEVCLRKNYYESANHREDAIVMSFSIVD